MPDVIPMMSALLVPVLVVAAHAVSRRPRPVEDPDRWRQEATEPWGTIGLATFLCSPVALGAWWATGSATVGAATLILVVVVLGWRTAAIRGIREVAVTDSVIWVRTLRHQRSIPLAHVLGVRRDGRGCEVVLASGRSIPLPDGSDGERLAATIERRARRWHRPALVTAER